MTVQELIDKLQQYNSPDLPVFIHVAGIGYANPLPSIEKTANSGLAVEFLVQFHYTRAIESLTEALKRGQGEGE